MSLTGSFRSWFVSRCNRVDFGFGHSLAGHDLYMKRYDRMTINEKVELYLRSEKLLQVFSYLDDDEQKKVQELQTKRILELESQMDSVNELLKRANLD